MGTEKRNFDKDAASWDENPARVKLAQDIAGAITKCRILRPEMDAMDFGCGTGLVTLLLRPRVRSIVGVDSSQGMLDVLQAKVARQNLTRVETQLVDLDKGDRLEGRYDLVVSTMTLHHVRDIAALFRQFRRVLAPAGSLALADLDSEGGLFHSDNTGVFHFGFDRVALRRILTDAGFEKVEDTTAAEVVKPTANGEERRFPIFLITATHNKQL
jgi:ubiquinone/menaquinone biosynthesis C-methylase UbiE